MFSERVKQGRILRRLSQQELADEVGISKQMISKYEKGISLPASDTLIKLSKALEVSPDFFFTPRTVELGDVRFRKRKNLSQRRIESIKEEIKKKLADYLELEEILGIESRFSNPAGDFECSTSDDAETVVHKIRTQWNIGSDPAHNIIQLLEDQRIKVIEIEEEENLFDGLAALVEEQYAVIVINKNFTVERKRFTLLHELGHLLMNLSECDEKAEEDICHRFASEFLFPEKSVFYEFGKERKAVSLRELIEVQKKYGISIRAIIYRLYNLGIISKNRHINFYRRLNSDPDLKREIDKERFATPEVSFRYEQLVYRALSQGLISANKASVFLSVNINEILESHSM